MAPQVTAHEAGYLARYQEHRDRLAGLGPDWIQPLREAGMERFREVGFPGPRDEAWRFTKLKPLERIDFGFDPEPPAGPEASGLLVASVAGEQPLRLVFVDGVLHSGLSRTPDDPAGPRLQGLLAGAAAEEATVRPLLGQVVDIERHRFSALNTAFLAGGAWVRVPAGWAGDSPIHLVFLSTGEGAPRAVHPRVLVRVEEGAEAVVLEEYLGARDAVTFTNAVTELALGKNAAVHHLRIQGESPEAFHVGSLSARLSRDSRLTSHALSLGGRLSRVDVDVLLDGEGSEVVLNGLYVLGGKQHMDHHTRVDHALPHTVSRELYQGVLGGKATAVFNGRVVIRADAQKVDASQNNNNLLLSDEALVNTNPELEIFADDVKAQHGATVGQIEDDHLFYLQSRGIDRETARRLLISAFARRIIERIPLESVRDAITELLEARS